MQEECSIILLELKNEIQNSDKQITRIFPPEKHKLKVLFLISFHFS